MLFVRSVSNGFFRDERNLVWDKPKLNLSKIFKEMNKVKKYVLAQAFMFLVIWNEKFSLIVRLFNSFA